MAAVAQEVRAVERAFPIRPQDLCEASDPEAELHYRKEQSRELMRLLGWQVRSSAGLVGALAGPQAAANQISPYLIGFADAIVRTAPDLVEELAAEMESAMCDDRTDQSVLVAIARVMQRMPELGNARSFDCVVEREVEDEVAFEVLEAWRRTPLEKSPALERFERDASEELQAQLVKHPQLRGEGLAETEDVRGPEQEITDDGEPVPPENPPVSEEEIAHAREQLLKHANSAEPAPPSGPALAMEKLQQAARDSGESPQQLLTDAIHELRWGKRRDRAAQPESPGTLSAEDNSH